MGNLRAAHAAGLLISFFGIEASGQPEIALDEILACHEAGITAFVPKTLTSGATAAGRFGKGDFIYDAAKNEYRCPAGQSLIWRFSHVEKGLKLHRYWSSNCQ